MNLLPYEKQILLDTLSEDCITITAEGIPIENVLWRLLESYCDPSSLVLAVEFPDYLEEWLLKQLTISETIISPPKKITADFSVDKRADNYLDGGVKFISKRILLIDLLQKRIPIDLITGLVFLNVNNVSDISTESFITRLFRHDNKTGFIKAFSSFPIQLSNHNQLEQSLNHLFLPKFYLWPRFHVNISESIDQHKCDVIELHIPLTEYMKSLQLSIIDLLHFCLKDLKKFIPSLETDSLQIENAITKNFYWNLKQKLDPVWSTLGDSARTTLFDIKTLSNLNNNLVRDDAVRFYQNVNRLRPKITPAKTKVSMWLFTEPFEKLLKLAKDRVEIRDKNVSPIELSPKWQAIKEILEEVMEDVNGKADKPILICVSSFVIARQIVEFIREGEVTTLKRALNRAQAQITDDDFDEDDLDKLGLEESHNIHFLILTRNMVLQDTLVAINPTFVIMYEPDLFLIRTFEIFRARRPGIPLRIYFLLYQDSMEEQRYLTHLTREKKAFEDMIHCKGKVAIHTDQDGKRGFNPLLERGEKSLKFEDVLDDEAGAESSRKGGKTSFSASSAFPKVIVDMREFRSSLPSILHKTGLDVIPKTIEIGDYILTPDVCVERKSINDLIGSLNSGRLYHQCQAMCRNYRHPILLIEFEDRRGFNLQNYSEVGEGVATKSLQTQIVLVTLHFPSLRLFWSESVYTTANMFRELKRGKPDPDTATVAKAHKDHTSDKSEFNHAALDMLLQLPGLSSKNYLSLARGFRDIHAIAHASECEITTILQHKDEAKKIFEFFRERGQETKKESEINNLRGRFAKYRKFNK